jgi:hypothetical protein
MVFTKHLGVLVASVVVFEYNLSIIEEKRSKDKGMLTLIKNKQRLMIHYPFDVNFNIFASSIKHLSVLRNSFQG